MGCPLWEEPPPPPSAKNNNKVRSTVRQRRPLLSDYGAPRSPIRRRGLPREPTSHGASAVRQPPSYAASSRRARQDGATRDIEWFGITDGPTSLEEARFRRYMRRMNNSDSLSRNGPSTLARDLPGQERPEGLHRARRSNLRHRVPVAIVDVALSPETRRDGGHGTSDRGVAVSDERGSALPNPPLPPEGDPRRAYIELARRLHGLAMMPEIRSRDEAYRRLLRDWSARALQADREYRDGLTTQEQAERPAAVYQELLRLGPEPQDVASTSTSVPPRLPSRAAATMQHGFVPSQFREPEDQVDTMNGLGDRERSLSPDDDNWNTLFSTVTPDPQPPSVGSSFASAAASQNTGNTSQTDLTRLSDIILGEHYNDDHECDGSCLFCPGDHDFSDESESDADMDMEFANDESTAQESSRQAANRHREHIESMLARQRARMSALAARLNLDHVDI